MLAAAMHPATKEGGGSGGVNGGVVGRGGGIVARRHGVEGENKGVVARPAAVPEAINQWWRRGRRHGGSRQMAAK